MVLAGTLHQLHQCKKDPPQPTEDRTQRHLTKCKLGMSPDSLIQLKRVLCMLCSVAYHACPSPQPDLPHSLQSAVGSRLPAPLSLYLPPGLCCLSHVVSRLLSGQLSCVDFGLPPLSAQKSRANVTSIMRHPLICLAARCPSLPLCGLWSFLIYATV